MNELVTVLVVEHERDADAALIGERLDAAGITQRVVGPDRAVPVPRSAAGVDGVLVMGGTPGPTNDEQAPWLPSVRALIADCLTTRTPYLGVCLGAQLLAHVAGGTVVSATRPEVGLLCVEPLAAAADDPLLGGLQGRAAALQWHWLEASRLPAGSVPLARSERCANQAFRVGDAAWGLQFHLEALPRTARAWVAQDREGLLALELDGSDIVRDVSEAEAGLRSTWSDVIDRWIGVVAGRRTRA